MNTQGSRRPIARRLRLPIALVTAVAVALTLMVVTHTGHRVARSEPPVVTIEAALAAFGSASQLYMKVDGITGDSPNVNHVGEIDIDSLSWGISNAKATSKGTAFENVAVTKGLDSASPSLMVATGQGRVVRTVEITAERADESFFQYAKLTFNNATFTSLHQDASRANGFDEKVTFTAPRITLTYVIMGPDGPSTDRTFTGTWDLKAKA